MLQDKLEYCRIVYGDDNRRQRVDSIAFIFPSNDKIATGWVPDFHLT